MFLPCDAGAPRHRSVATLSGTPGARRDTHERNETQRIAGKDSHGAASIRDASGVRLKAGRSGRPNLLNQRRGNRSRRSRRRGAATASECRAVRREPQASRAQHAAGGGGESVRTRANTSAGRGAQPGARRSRHRRSTKCDERCAKREHETTAATGRTTPVNVALASAVGHTAVSAASRRPSEARNERSEWRRQGLQRKARPRSGSPESFAP